MRRAHRQAHRLGWMALALSLPLILIAAFLLSQDPKDLPPNERLGAPGAASEEGTK
ncbi:MAG: hypothetical protein MRY74_15170 [Neomegalonema sp.]|nr:hypothetical protein [Neomegalonema sp.]